MALSRVSTRLWRRLPQGNLFWAFICADPKPPLATHCIHSRRQLCPRCTPFWPCPRTHQRTLEDWGSFGWLWLSHIPARPRILTHRQPLHQTQGWHPTYAGCTHTSVGLDPKGRAGPPPCQLRSEHQVGQLGALVLGQPGGVRARRLGGEWDGCGWPRLPIKCRQHQLRYCVANHQC